MDNPIVKDDDSGVGNDNIAMESWLYFYGEIHT